MKKIYYSFNIIAIATILVFTSNSAMGQAKCSTALPLTIGANDATCNSQTIATPTKLSNNTPPITTVSGPACGLATGIYSNWFSFTGDGSTIRVKISGQDHVVGMTVFENQTCGATMTAKLCGTYADDNISHALDVPTVNGASYLVAVVANSSSLIGKVCAYKTNGLPYSSLCDASPTPITVKTKNVDCFAAGNFVNVSTNHTIPAPATPCAPATLDEWWLGTFTAIDTKTELYFWGKDQTNASIEVLEGPCQAGMTSVFCTANSGAKDNPNWGSMTTVIGKQYYVVIRTSSVMNAGRLCIYSQPTEPAKTFCTADMSFESGSAAAWNGTYGSYHLVSAPGSVFKWDNGNVGKPAPRFALTSGTGVDPFISGMLPIVAPGGGSYSFRIGSNAGSADPQPPTDGYAGTAPNTHASVEEMDYSFVVSSATAGFGYKYAVVIDYSAHPAEQQPLFDVVLTLPNSGNAVIPCGNYTHFAGDGVSPFKFVGTNTDVSGSNHGPLFCPWTDVITDLSGYAGQTVNARFRVRDCEGGMNVTGPPYQADLEGGSHWCYAYFDTYCIPIAITVPEYCGGTTSIQICGPPGYQTYTWPAGQPGVTGALNGQCVTITNPSNYSGTTYTVNATSITGCPITATVKLNSIPLTVTAPVSICPGNSASISVAVTNSTNPPYTFSWSNGLGTGAGPKTVTPGATTTYVVTVTNGSGCTSTQAVTVNVAACGITATTTPATICNGTCGTISATGANGTAPYVYTWSPATGLSATTGASISACPTTNTTYTVTVKDNNGTGASTSAIAVVTVKTNPTVTVPPATICAGTPATLTASGGTTYTWSPGTGLSATTGATVTATPASTSTYTVVGTTAGCTGSTTVIVTVNPKPVVSVPSASICPGGSTPLTASGGTTYTWSPATGLSATTGATVTANPGATSTYTVIGTSLTCTGSTTVVVTVGALVANAGPNVAICSGGSTNLSASGGTIFTWTPATGLSSTTISNPVANPVVTTTYSVVVSDGSCSDDAVVIVTVNPNPVVSVPSATICAGTSATLIASGATTYTWTPATGLSATTGATVTATPAATSTYTVTGSFATGCTGVTTVIVTVNPIPVIVSNPVTICQGNAAPLSASGADIYSWSPAGSLSPSTGANVMANPTVTTTYTVVGTITATGCTGKTTVIVTVIPPCGPNVNATGVTVCNGVCGTVTSTATGGVPPYTYLWNTGATSSSLTPSPCPTVTTTYTVTVTDNSSPVGTATAVAVITVNPNPVVTVPAAVICNGACTPLTASGATTYTWSPATGLSATTGASVTACPTATTTYTVTGSFATGCTGITTVLVTVNPIPVISVPNASICPGGSTILNATGANTYTWSPATGLSATTGASVTANPAGTTTYTVVGTSLSCSSSTTVVVSVGALVADAGLDKFICSGGSVGLNATGGTIFTWTPATGLSNATVSNPTASPAVTTTYTVTVSDGFCSDDDVVIVTVNPPIVLNAAGVDVTCFGACNGQIIVIPSGGTAPYTYAWSSGCTAAACNNICAGTYSLVTTDAMACTASATATVTQPTALSVALTGSTNVSCFGMCDGTTGVSAAGGTVPYTYSWTPSGGTSANAIGLCAGSYTCTLTDANNCSVKTSVTITQPTAVIVNSANADICPNTCATLNATGSGGTGAINFSWSPGGSTGNAVSVCPASTTTYTITGTDLNGCTGFTTVVVTVEPTPIVTVPAATICAGTITTLTASGAATYSWLPATGLSAVTGTTVTANPTLTTTYTVTGTSAFGCTGSVEVTVTVNPIPVLSSSGGNACPGDSIALSVSGAATYSWSPSTALNITTGPNVTARPANTIVYTITATGANGCTAAITATATVNPKPDANFSTSPDVVDLFDPTVYFNDHSTGGIISSWKWNLGDPKNTTSVVQNPSFRYPDTTGKYQVQLIVTNQFGCIDTVTGTVIIHGIFTFYIPNTFTPDDDGINDRFMPKGTGIDETDYDLWIFDRWGNLIWHTDIWGESWDGKANGGAEIAQIDTYVWKVHVKEKDAGTIHNYIGHVNIVK
jgi:gliding motility-associated-like protein